MTLRDYQQRAVDGVRAEFNSGARSVLLVLPTGAGKTRTASEMVSRATSRGLRTLWLAHRGELVDQAAEALASCGLHVGAMSASAQTRPHPYAPVQVATIQTLLARRATPPADLIIVDEAHRAIADEWATFVRSYPSAHVVGLTATPERSDGRGLGEMFQRIVVGVTVRELTERGFLVPCEILRPARALRSGELAQSPVEAYMAHARDRQTVLFCRSVELAREYLAAMVERGVRAALVTGETPWGDRVRALEAFRTGGVEVLVNVAVLTEGFDAPATSCVVLARGCGTAGLYLQIVGRALRPAPGKRDALLIDLRGVSHEHGEPADERVYSLDGVGIRSKDQAVYCPVCAAMREAGEGCTACGWTPSGEGIGADSVVGEPLVKYAAKRAEDDDKRAETLARWMRDASAKGYRAGWAYAKYAAVYGARPSQTVLAKMRGAA